MKRREFIPHSACGIALGSPLFAAVKEGDLNAAGEVLEAAAANKQIHAASLYVRQGDQVFARSFGLAKKIDDIFLLASISKTISAATVMKLQEEEKFSLDDSVTRFIPEFTGEGRDKITVRQLLTHVSGLPDQLPQNAALRARHAGLQKFVEATIHTPLLFAPGERYSYSSMAILLATEVAERISKTSFPTLVEETIYEPLQMKHSAMGIGHLDPNAIILNQLESAAPESGAGDPTTKSWDWNSPYWRNLGAPWGGAHGSAPDMAKFLSEFLHPTGTALKPETTKLMITNQNAGGIRPRGLGFDVGKMAGGAGCGELTFGHTGSTGTLCWADPASDTICVVLTTLPAHAMDPHPRDVASDRVAEAAG